MKRQVLLSVVGANLSACHLAWPPHQIRQAMDQPCISQATVGHVCGIGSLMAAQTAKTASTVICAQKMRSSREKGQSLPFCASALSLQNPLLKKIQHLGWPRAWLPSTWVRRSRIRAPLLHRPRSQSAPMARVAAPGIIHAHQACHCRFQGCHQPRNQSAPKVRMAALGIFHSRHQACLCRFP
jgi:hypothetical protein